MLPKTIELSPGVALNYVEHGARAGFPVVFLHGLTDSWRSFELVMPHLSPSIRAFALTQRGHGDSDRPATGYRSGDFSADVAAFLTSVGIDAALLVGHSLGSTNAMRFAI